MLSDNLCDQKNISEIFDTVKMQTGINSPYAILMPICQKRFISVNSDDIYKVTVRLVTRQKIFDTITISPAEIENPNMIYRFGAKGVKRLSDDDWQDCKQIFHILSNSMPEIIIYNFVGHVPDKKQYILGNYLVTSTGYRNINNGLLKGNFEVASASADFFLKKYVPCFRNQTEGLIILFSLLLSVNLSRMAAISNERPSFVVAIVAPTGSYKTATVQATLNPYQDSSFSISSFEDTSASIIAALKQTRDIVSIVDDFYTNSDTDITAKLEKIIRLNGDKSSVRKKMSGSKIVSDSSDTITVITGEQVPEVRVSSIPRMLIINFENAVDLKALTVLQNSQPEFRGALIRFIQYTLSDDKYCEKLIDRFLQYRNEMTQQEHPKWHSRYTSMCCWFLAMHDIFCDFCKAELVPYAIIKDFPQNVKEYITTQCKRYLENDAIYVFFKSIEALVAKKDIIPIYESKIGNDTPKSDLIYSDDFIWVESLVVYEKILHWCQQESIQFNASRMELYRQLADDGLLILQKNRLTDEYRKGKFRQSTVCLARNNIRRYFSDKKEDTQ